MMLCTTNSESLNYQLRKVTKARGHFPSTTPSSSSGGWPSSTSRTRAREREARRQQDGKHHDQSARLVKGQRVMGWRKALDELDIAYPG